ncbi:MAG: hypothetical protein WCX46_04055 [Candidatus Paceibacterota bacterium]|jgi:hypothetical protein
MNKTKTKVKTNIKQFIFKSIWDIYGLGEDNRVYKYDFKNALWIEFLGDFTLKGWEGNPLAKIISHE